jgi:hypothetical protein
MINKSIAPLNAKIKRHIPMTLKQKMSRVWDGWFEDDNDITQIDLDIYGLDIYQDHDAHRHGGVEKMRQPTDYETAEHDKKVEKKKEKEKQPQLPKYLL